MDCMGKDRSCGSIMPRVPSFQEQSARAEQERKIQQLEEKLLTIEKIVKHFTDLVQEHMIKNPMDGAGEKAVVDQHLLQLKVNTEQQLGQLHGQQQALEKNVETRLAEITLQMKSLPRTDEMRINKVPDATPDPVVVAQLHAFGVTLDELSHKMKNNEADCKALLASSIASHTVHIDGALKGVAQEDVEKRRKAEQEEYDLEKRLSDLILQQRSELEAVIDEKIRHVDERTSHQVGAAPDKTEISSDKESGRVSYSSAPDFHADKAHRSNLEYVLDNVAVDADWKYEFDESLWDAFFLIGTRGQSKLDILMHILITCVYLFVMTSMVYVIADGFAQDPYAASVLDRLKFWRATQGHSLSHVNKFDASSLTSRVCSDDPALTVATNQQSAYADIQAYQAPNFLPFLETGPLVCVCCVGIYCMELINDIEDACHTLIGVLGLRHPERTRMQWRKREREMSCTLTQVSYFRCGFALFAFLVRTCFSMILIYYGSLWLVFTTNIPNLLLNTTALSFLLGVDGDMFKLGAPHVLRVTMASLEPLHMPRVTGIQFMPIAFVLGVIGLVLMFYYQNLQLVREQMDLAAEILCGNDIDFVASNTEGIGVHWTPTDQYNPDVPMKDWADARYHAIHSIIMKKDGYVFQLPNLEDLGAFSTMSFHSYVSQLQTCSDKPSSNIGGHLYVISNNESMLEHVKTCADAKQYCLYDNTWARMVRVMCPATCGCVQPDSGLMFLSDVGEGCRQREQLLGKCTFVVPIQTPSCAAISTPTCEKIIKRSCSDMPLELLQPLAVWNRTLYVVARSARFLNTSDPQTGTLAHSELANFGCAGLWNLSNYMRKKICDSYTVPFLCPNACECLAHGNGNSSTSVDCPLACQWPSYTSSPSPSPSPALYGGGIAPYT